MIRQLIRCDGCRAEVTADRVRLGLDLGTAPSSWSADPATGRPGIDLCGSCKRALLDWLRKNVPLSVNGRRA
jgi:hypothetical protein